MELASKQEGRAACIHPRVGMGGVFAIFHRLPVTLKKPFWLPSEKPVPTLALLPRLSLSCWAE